MWTVTILLPMVGKSERTPGFRKIFSKFRALGSGICCWVRKHTLTERVRVRQENMTATWGSASPSQSSRFSSCPIHRICGTCGSTQECSKTPGKQPKCSRRRNGTCGTCGRSTREKAEKKEDRAGWLCQGCQEPLNGPFLMGCFPGDIKS